MFFNCILVYPQYNRNAPWITNNAKAKAGQATIDELVASFDQYWLTRDRSQKGSGYKPFMRWENHWRNKTNAQSYCHFDHIEIVSFCIPRRFNIN